ncbi:hypothetical protein POM88_054476 [Heracleum sosnowskyi]|uniref:Uncharacterized protein n=1 Tax=Heracleum sosnowskyi TaxID=360622 RepID=A0AAD8GN03_9APIA|nr:hypothetical protein POM88_054476 [Heracleum sosnowskyi]
MHMKRQGHPKDVHASTSGAIYSEQLRINDGIFYARCRDIVCGVGNIERHLTVLDHLASSGQLLYMAGKFFFTIVYKNESTSVDMLRDLLAIRSHPYYRKGITTSLTHIRSIKICVVVSNTGPIFDIEALCPLHFMVVDMT